jgi:hypothetical protein
MFFENGSKLKPRLVPQTLSNAATALVEALNLNSITEARRAGRTVIIKRRNLAGQPLAELANAYFRKARIPIHFVSDLEEWRRREITSFNMLNGDGFRARPSGKASVIEDKLPGESLWDHMKRGTLTETMLRAAGRELHRAHRFWDDNFRRCWSHGDATTTNAIYDEKTGRVRLIDFEIEHDRSVPVRARQADDLFVFLLDMVGLIPSRKWLPFALCFLEAYHKLDVILELRKRLILPGGLAWVWWEVRTNFTAPGKMKRRLARLRAAIPMLDLYRTAAARDRHKRRPSIVCHAIKPGMPKASSRPLAIRERAKAASPGKPSRLPTTR